MALETKYEIRYLPDKRLALQRIRVEIKYEINKSPNTKVGIVKKFGRNHIKERTLTVRHFTVIVYQ